MSILINLNLFGNVLHSTQTNQRWISDLQLIWDGGFKIYCQEVISYWQSSTNLDDGEILELLLFAIIFSFYGKIESIGEDKDLEDSRISHTGTFFFFLGASKKVYIFILGFLQSVIWINSFIFEIFE